FVIHGQRVFQQDPLLSLILYIDIADRCEFEIFEYIPEFE
ncbi:12446_t:CDS:1, partial [Gigaspora margarita]